MTHLTIREWGRVEVDRPGGFTRAQANALIAAAKAHPLGGEEGVGVLSDHHGHLRAKQMVGVIAAKGCSLEVLPKVDPDAVEEAEHAVRHRLINMLDVAHGLKLGDGAAAAMAQQKHSLLDILIRLFADRLLAETRRGLPRSYVEHEDDLPALRGRLNVTRQFTTLAVRPDKLACRFDNLTSDIALMHVMKACVVFLARHAKAPDTRRLLGELRFVLAEISDVPSSALPWAAIRFDRTNRRWEALFALAKLFLKREWQATHHDASRDSGITLLFPMNDLFEKYVAALLRRALAKDSIEVVEQGGRLSCLGDWNEGVKCKGHSFMTKPDLLLRRGGEVVAIIDTKWKHVSANPFDEKKGFSQADVYQMMAYAHLYKCERLMLLYPATPGTPAKPPHRFGIHGGPEMLALGKVDVSRKAEEIVEALRPLALELVPPKPLRAVA